MTWLERIAEHHPHTWNKGLTFLVKGSLTRKQGTKTGEETTMKKIVVGERSGLGVATPGLHVGGGGT